MSDPRRRLKVMVVDDSAVVRQLLKTMLERQTDLEVATAADPLIARSKMERFEPDVLVLDLEMPRMDGLSFLRQIMLEKPLPVVICSSHVGRGTRFALEAMALGAVDIILKPETGIKEFLEESSITITDVVRAAACTRVRARRPAEQTAALWTDTASPRRPAKPAGAAVNAGEPVVAIGASTGGPGALAQILSELPDDPPPILVVQHMPRAFTAAFAQQLDRISPAEVREAADGDQLRRNLVLIAPGGQHLLIKRIPRGYAVRIVDGPLVSRHRPSVDVLFSSVAEQGNPQSLGVILTGMGDDGVDGLLRMRKAGMTTIAQEHSSCAVFGMPKEAIARSAVDHVLSLSEIAQAIGGSATTGRAWSPAFSATERKARRERLKPKGAGSWKTIDPPG